MSATLETATLAAERPAGARTRPEPSAPILTGAFLCVVVLAPLPLASNRPFWWSLLAIAMVALLAIHATNAARRRGPTGLGLSPVAGIALPFLGVLVWALIQALPVGDLGIANPFWPLAAEALGTPLAGAISLSPHETVTGVLRLATYGAAFWLALQFGRDRAFADRFIRWIAYAGAAYALYGLALRIFGIERILWFPKWAYEGYLSSTFVNRNSYATYAILGLACAAALLLNAFRDGRRPAPTFRLRIILFIERLTGRAARPLLLCTAIGLALLQTGSRAGALSAFAGGAVFLIAAAASKLMRRLHAAQGIAALLILGVVGTLATGGTILDRLESGTVDEDKGARGALYALTIDAMLDEPLLGTGLGTFPEVFSIYRDGSFDTLAPIGKAHSTYLGNALELGMPATILLLASFAAIGTTLIAGLYRRKRGRLFPVIGLASLAAVACHSTVDFSLEIPAVALTYAALAGVACAQSFKSRKPPKVRPSRRPALRVLVNHRFAPAQPSGDI